MGYNAEETAAIIEYCASRSLELVGTRLVRTESAHGRYWSYVEDWQEAIKIQNFRETQIQNIKNINSIHGCLYYHADTFNLAPSV